MDSASSKLKRATKYINELNELFREKRPFRYIVVTNTRTGDRATRAKKDEPVIAAATEIASDAIQNIRTALDYAYWDIVSPFATSPKEEAAVQFPFSKTAARLEVAVKNRLAHKVSDRFFKTIIGLKPYGEAGGNRILYAIHDLAAPDRHRVPVPTGNYREISGSALRAQIPDFPMGGGNFEGNVFVTHAGGASASGDMGWVTPRHILASIDLGNAIPPTTFKFEKELNVPVFIALDIGSDGPLLPMIPLLHEMVSTANQVIRLIRKAAK